MATVLYRYHVGQEWNTHGPTIMSIGGARRLRDRLLREGYQVIVKYLS
jgi:hypothetical protein